jgi:hypothetical protein
MGREQEGVRKIQRGEGVGKETNRGKELRRKKEGQRQIRKAGRSERNKHKKCDDHKNVGKTV